MKKVICFGTFDNLHPGHLSYFEQARKYGDHLLVVVARDKNVAEIKGRLPKQDETTRLDKVRKVDLVDKAILGRLKNKLKVVEEYQPDVICLGYDQKADISKLKQIADHRIKRLKPYDPAVYKSSKMR